MLEHAGVQISRALACRGVGCIFIEMVTGAAAFPGVKDTGDQLEKIWKVRKHSTLLFGACWPRPVEGSFLLGLGWAMAEVLKAGLCPEPTRSSNGGIT